MEGRSGATRAPGWGSWWAGTSETPTVEMLEDLWVPGEGAMDGDAVGCNVGLAVGSRVGVELGSIVGMVVGSKLLE